MKREKFRTYENVFDEQTLRGLFKLASQGYFEELKSPISVGKESNVFSATTKDKRLVCVKIYRINTCDFNKMYRYMKADPRYTWLKKQKRKVIYSWAKREFRNLHRARTAGVKVPTPLAVYNNILVMEFIGKEEAAPKLRNAIPQDMEKFYNKLKKQIEALHNKALLIHADLSEYNILNDNDQPAIIDLSHSIRPSYPEAEALLKRDINQIDKFAKKQGAKIKEWNFL